MPFNNPFHPYYGWTANPPASRWDAPSGAPTTIFGEAASGSNRPTVTKRGPEAQLAGLKALLDENGAFVWTKIPENDPRGRGLYPTITWTLAWYQGALSYGFTPEDIGFYPDDLYHAWFNFVEQHWPGDKRNLTSPESVTFEHMMPWQEGFVFPS